MAEVGKIFLNYRRADADSWADRLYDRLATRLAAVNVLMDINGAIPLGLPSVRWLESQVADCDVMLVLIGRSWGLELQARLASGEQDFVRIEIESALLRDIPVVPVLVGDAPMPLAADLPASIKRLADLQVARLSRASFDADVKVLIDTMAPLIRQGRMLHSESIEANVLRTAPPILHKQERIPHIAVWLAAAWSSLFSFASNFAHRLRSALAWTAGLVATASLATYALALVALESLEPPDVRQATLPGDALAGAATPLTVSLTPERTAELRRGDRLESAVAGHGAPLTSAALVAGGSEVVTASADGAVRLTSAPPSLTGAPHALALLGEVVKARLWQPHGEPLARAALEAVASVLPLAMPQHATGRRGRVFRDCKDTFCGSRMVEIGAGHFLMGSPWLEKGRSANEGPRRMVTIARPFAIGRFAVTFDEWDECVAAGGCKIRPDDAGWGRGMRPVINVSWNDITDEYLPWLNAKLGLKGADRYRLPSEAEWEYAARAGSTEPFAWGSGIDTMRANYNGKFSLDGPLGSGLQVGKTLPVDAFTPNAFSLYQMHGNVWQWVQDCYHASYAAMPDSVRSTGAAWDSDCVTGEGGATERVGRGGSWLNVPEYLRSAHRDRTVAGLRGVVRGFRVARTLTSG